MAAALYHHSSRLVYIRSLAQAESELSSLQRGPLGFDLEWKPVFKKGQGENPVALVQLANADTVFLIQVHYMPRFPRKLQEILEDPSIVKAGVGIQYDTKKLFKDHAVSTRNCVDLSLLARSVDNARWKGQYATPIGLARLVEHYQQASLPKGKIQRSNWESLLTDQQQTYAANDAHAGYSLYTRFMRMSRAMQIAPRPLCYSFNAINGSFYEPSGIKWAPHNPDYDPGPPPPPKVRKEKGPDSSPPPVSPSLRRFPQPNLVPSTAPPVTRIPPVPSVFTIPSVRLGTMIAHDTSTPARNRGQPASGSRRPWHGLAQQASVPDHTRQPHSGDSPPKPKPARNRYRQPRD